VDQAGEYRDPFDLFRDWYDEACRSSLALPNAMGLATVRADGSPAARMVILGSFDRRGFVFHTNYESGKGAEIAACPRAALLFWWEPLNRQVRIEGAVERTAPGESDASFAGRPRVSQLGAWASDQSRPLPLRETLEARVREFEAHFEGIPVPRPPHWGGYRVIPGAFEFWTGREDRLHERIRFDRTSEGWAATRLYLSAGMQKSPTMGTEFSPTLLSKEGGTWDLK
jgi:pyridoxamine 5'-phosphate oxidase